MADAIKGITIEFRGNATPLQKAIRTVNSEISKTTKELTAVNKALKFNPTSVDLWRQKQDLLKQKISETKEKLDVLKQQQKQMDASGVDKQSEAYRKLEREIIETNGKLKTFKQQLREIGNVKLTVLSEQFKDVGSKIETVGKKMEGVSTAAGIVAGAIGAIAVQAGRAADDLNTLSKVTGIGTDDLQKYQVAADLVDVSVGAIAKAQMKLKKNLYQVGIYAKGPAEEFESLGVAVTDSAGNLRDSDEVFQDVITALGQITNETERDAIAQKLMGKSAAELNPLIEDQGETYKRVSDTLKKYDLSFPDQETLDNANEFNDELDTMKLLGTVAFQSMSTELEAYLAPSLEKVVDLVGRFANWLSNLDPRLLAVIGGVAALVVTIAPLLITFGKLFNGISAVIKVISLLSSGIGLLGSGALIPIIAVIAAVIAAGVLLYKNWDTIKAKCKELGDKIKSIWNSVKDGIKTAAKAIFDAMVWPYKKAWDTIVSIVKKIKGLFPIDIKNLFSKIKTPHFSVEWGWVEAFGKKVYYPAGFDIDWYKNGGIFSSPSLIGVGEAGSEAVVPLDKFWNKLDAIAESASSPTINIYATPGMDVNQLAQKVEAVLVRQQRQRMMANGNI